MRRGKITFSGASWVAYDYTTLYRLTKFQRFMLKHLPSLYWRKIELNQSVLSELSSFLKDRRSVEIVFWEPKLEDAKIAKQLFKKVTKRDGKGEPFIKGIEYPATRLQTIFEIKRKDYDKFFTNRIEIVPYFSPDFICFTQIDNRVDIKRLSTLNSKNVFSKHFKNWRGIK